jgi:hypothetical protein
MNQKREMKMSKGLQTDFDLTDGEYKMVRLDLLKSMLCGWLDFEMKKKYDKGEETPEFNLKREDNKLFLTITEENSEDFMDEGTEYFMVLKSLKDEDGMKQEIEFEKQYNKEHGVLVRQAFPFPIGVEEE